MLFAVVAFPGSAYAEGYIQGSGGASVMQWLDVGGVPYKFNTGYALGASAGMSLNNLLGPNWDLRGDVFYSRNRYSCCSSHLGGVSFMADLIYHFDLGLRLKPYVGVGLGGVAIQFGPPTPALQESQVTFGQQAIAGVEYPIGGRFSTFAEYRFVNAVDARFEVGPVEYRSHNFTVGLKMSL